MGRGEHSTILEMRDITKRFGGVLALDGVTFSCATGEVHALVGENGAGKSTLMRILAGVFPPDSGQIYLRGQRIQIESPRHARTLGIGVVHQELSLLPYLSVAQNIFLGREPRTRLGLVDARRLHQEAGEILRRLGVDIDPEWPVSRLSVAQQQMVEVARVLSDDAQIVVFDEPTAPLGVSEVRTLLHAVRTLKGKGVTVVYISHRLPEVFEVADRVTVLKDGRVVTTRRAAELNHDQLIRLMVGRALSDAVADREAHPHDVVLELREASSFPVLHQISLALRRGEVLGVAGLMGSGRTSLAGMIFGVLPLTGGEMVLGGLPFRPRGPRDAIRMGFAYVSEDRKGDGLIMGLPVRHNISLPSLPHRARLGIVNERQERGKVSRLVQELRIRTAHVDEPVRNLSGGNQQKVVLAKWLLSGPDLLILDEPTRGVDVGAKAEIWSLIRRLAAEGKAILMMSSDLPEVLAVSDRVAVMYQGGIRDVLPTEAATEENIMRLATGIAEDFRNGYAPEKGVPALGN